MRDEKKALEKEQRNSDVIALLQQTAKIGVSLFLENDKLKLKIAKEVTIDPILLEGLKTYKEEIIELLKTENSKLNSVKQNSFNNFSPEKRLKYDKIQPSYAQERLWFIDKLNGTVNYHIPNVYTVYGELDEIALEKAFNAVINRHQVLKTVIREENGEVFQELLEDNWKLNFKNETEICKDQIMDMIHSEINKPFNLSEDFMICSTLYKRSESEHILVFIVHHIAFDGWSLEIFLRELVECYSAIKENRKNSLLNMEWQYVDYSIWQRQILEDESMNIKLDYWSTKLADIEPIHLPIDFKRPLIQSFKGSHVVYTINADLTRELQMLCKQQNVTLFMILLTTFKLTLSRFSGQQDICVGTPVSNRTKKELEALIGFFVNTLAIRSEIKNDESFLDLLHRVKATTLDAFAYQDVPFEKVVERVGAVRDLSRSQLFQTFFVLQNQLNNSSLQFGNLNFTPEKFDYDVTKFELTFNVVERTDGIDIIAVYCTDLFQKNTIERIVQEYAQFLQLIVNNPQEKVGNIIPFNKNENSQLFKTFGQSRISYAGELTILDLFENQVITNPNLDALVFEGKKLSYRQLDEKSNQLAHFLSEKNIDSEIITIAMGNHLLDTVIAIFAILKTGKAYLPIDLDQPIKRLNAVLGHAKPGMVLTTIENEKLLKDLENNVPVFAIDDTKNGVSQKSVSKIANRINATDLLYVIYTSGSTGVPKGVMISHGGVIDYVFGLYKEIDFTSFSTVGLMSTMTADLGKTVLFGGLLSGASVHLFTKDMLRDADKLHDYFKENTIDFIKIVPSHWKVLELDGNILLPQKAIMFGGEELTIDCIEKIRNSSQNCSLYNHYGPTETTIGKFIFQVDLNSNYLTIPIGKPFCNTQVYVVDRNLKPCPLGVSGELLIGGRGIATGYLHQLDLTEKQFIKNEIENSGSSLLYRTGDLVKWLPDGNMVFLGRIDEQIKIRGHRVEISEIESILQEIKEIQQCAILVKIAKSGDKCLVAYVVSDKSIEKEKLREYLAKRLPDFMVPSFFLQVNQLPLNANGKLNRKELPEISDNDLFSKIYVAPRNLIEEKLVSIWLDILKVDRVGIKDNFFNLGGHSLLVTRSVSAIRKELRIDITIRDFFENPVLEQLADCISKLKEDSSLPIIELQKMPSQIPLSYSQERLWFIDQLEGSVSFHIPTLYKIKGEIDVTCLQSAFQQIVNRHEVLRSKIEDEEGVPYQTIGKKDQWTLEYIEETTLSEKLVENSIQNRIKTPFDLSKDSMLRAHLYKIDESNYSLLIVIHHIASDGWSRSIFMNELVQFYLSEKEGKEIKLPELEIQYKDYAVWQRAYLSEKSMKHKLSYWRNQLKGSTLLRLYTDYSYSNKKTNKGNVLHFNFGIELSEALSTFSKQKNVTLFMSLLAGLKILLHKYSGQDDICIGTSIANRTNQETEKLIGFLLNTLALRSRINREGSFSDLLQEVKTTTLDAYTHQDVPFEKVLEQVDVSRNGNNTPLFQVMFILQNTPDIPTVELGEVTLSLEALGYNTSKFDLTFYASETSHGLDFDIEFCTEIFKESTINKMFDHFKAILLSVLDQPEKSINSIELYQTREMSKMLSEVNQDYTENKEGKTIISLFEETVVLFPEKIAVICEEKSITYSELNKKVNQLAHFIINKGIKTEDFIAIYLDRSIDMIIAMLGILKSGAAYVPIDISYPVNRVNAILEDTSVAFMITNNTLQSEKIVITPEKYILLNSELFHEISVKNPVTIPLPSNLAYVIYTSGSTGVPKGILIEHRSIIDYVLTFKNFFNLSQDDRVIQQSSIAFDTIVEEIYPTLISGATVYMIKEGGKDIYTIKKLIENEGITLLSTTPMVLDALNEELLDTHQLRYIISGGELLQSKQIDNLFGKTTIVNTYGPSETTVCATYHVIDELEKTSLIGKPIRHSSVLIIDANNKLLPPGLVGEIYIGGSGLARGYLNNKKLTNEYFVQSTSLGGARYYKTGDMGRWLLDGTIEFIGRKDEQVSIRGYRIELGEIENNIIKHPDIKHAVVNVVDDNEGTKRLVAYVVAESFDQEELIAHLESYLPDYMLPRFFIQLDEIPVNTNGKINRKNLPLPDFSKAVLKEYIAPRNEIEEQLVIIWKELLGVDQVGIYDNFFELGGHSLMAVRLISKINKFLQINLHIATLFESPNIDLLSKRCSKSNEINSTSLLIPINNKFGNVNLFLVPGIDGNILSFRKLGELYQDQPLFTFLPITKDGNVIRFSSIEEMAAAYVSEIIEVYKGGRLIIGGYSFGALVAFEMTRLLEEKGYAVSQLVILERNAPQPSLDLIRTNTSRGEHLCNIISIFGNYIGKELNISAVEFIDKTEEKQLSILNDLLIKNQVEIEIDQLNQMINMYINNFEISNIYNVASDSSVQASITLFKTQASIDTFGKIDPIFHKNDFGWGDYTQEKMNIYKVKGDHWTFLDSPHVKELADNLRNIVNSLNSDRKNI